MDDFLSEDFIEQFILKRLVYVNSAHHGYSEFELDKNLAMFGGNNIGKTSALAGTKIGLYPEVSFLNCETVFKFEGKKGLYSYDKSYEHYFPDPRSFIILEIKNPHGSFCMVCFKTGNYRYARFFIPQSYHELRHLFALEQPEDNFSEEKDEEPDYELNPELSVAHVAEYCDSVGGLKISQYNELVQLMFGSRLDIREKSRFCVLPLVSDKEDAIRAFRSIYQLAFDSKHSEEDDLAEAIATLVEMKRGREKEKLDANLTSLVEEFNSLNERNEFLQSLQNAKLFFDSAYKALNEAKKEYQAYSHEFQAVNALHLNKIAGHKKLVGELSDKVRTALSEKNHLTEVLRETSASISENSGVIKTLEGQSKILAKEITDAKSLRARYVGKSDAEIIEWCDNDIEDLEKKIDLFQTENGVVKQLEESIKEQNKLLQEKLSLENSIARINQSLLSQLPDNASQDVLFSLNEYLADPVVELSSEDIVKIQNFTDLFGVDGAGRLTVKGVTIDSIETAHYEAEKTLEKWSTRLQKISEKLSVLSSDITRLSRSIKSDDIEKLLKDAATELKNIQDERNAIASIGGMEKQLEECIDKLNGQKLKQDTRQIEFEKLSNAHGLATSNHSSLNAKLEYEKQIAEGFEKIRNRLNSASELTFPSAHYDGTELNIELSIEAAEHVYERALEFASKLNKLQSTYLSLEGQLFHPDVENEKQLHNLHEYEKRLNIYANSYATLEYDLGKLQDEIQTHNQRVNSQLQELKEAEYTLLLERDDINKDLNVRSVSNLSGFALEITLKPSFMDIMATLKKHDIQEGKFLDAKFYSTITKFSARFFDKKTGRLKLKDIIQSVDYSFTHSDGVVERKSQSGGTSTTITAFVISALMSRITDIGATLKMPIIIDEIGTLDSRNIASTIAQIMSHGFSVFCATPSYSALVDKNVGRHIYIDKYHVKDQLVAGCKLKNIPRRLERWGDK